MKKITIIYLITIILSIVFVNAMTIEEYQGKIVYSGYFLGKWRLEVPKYKVIEISKDTSIDVYREKIINLYPYINWKVVQTTTTTTTFDKVTTTTKNGGIGTISPTTTLMEIRK